MGAKWLLLWTPDGAAPSTGGAHPPPTGTRDDVAAAVAAVCGPPTSPWSADVTLWRSPHADLAVVSVGDGGGTHVIAPRARAAAAVDGPSGAALITRASAFELRGRLSVEGATHAGAGDVVARVGCVHPRRGGDAPPRAVVVQVEAAAADDLAEAAPALADFCGALSDAVAARRREGEGGGGRGSGSGDGGLAPLPVPLADYALPRGARGAAAADAVLLAHLAGAVLGEGRVKK